MSDVGATPRIIESARRLSQSYLWQILRNYYNEKALDAWTDSKIPFHITSNPFIAHAYAQVVCGYLKDLADNGEAPSQPLPIIDLGAGSGAFAFHFLNQFEQLRKHDVGPALPFVYVMTDFAPATVDSWQRHPQLTPFVDAGILDFACFDPLTDTSLTLRHSGRTLSSAQPTSLVAIANYFFDSMPQDLFGLENGLIFEIGVTVLSRGHQDSDAPMPALTSLDFDYVYQPIHTPYYEDVEFERVLHRYADALDGEVVRFPVGPMACCHTLRALSGNDLLLIAGDRGFVHAEELSKEQVELLFNVHDGAFSMPVNLHAIGEYLCGERGSVLRPPRFHRSLCISAFVTQPKAQRQMTHNAFRNHITQFGPDDISTLTYRLTQEQILSIECFVSLLHLTHHDPLVLKRCLPLVREQLTKMTKAELDVFVAEIAQVWANYYNQKDRYNLPFELGVLMQHLGRNREAVHYYRASQHYYGDTLETLFNLSTCLYQLGERQQALSLLADLERLEIIGPPMIQKHYRRRLEALRVAIQSTVDPE
ncbi:hypothetical protein GC175_26065 [bacterium]|nr:hypothetical protein [bacterium]